MKRKMSERIVKKKLATMIEDKDGEGKNGNKPIEVD